MRKSALALSIICFLVFAGCGRDEEPAQQADKETGQAVEEAKEKTETAVKDPAEDTEEKTEPAEETDTRETTGDADEDKTGEAVPQGLPDVIEMTNKQAFKEHRMEIVNFEHQKHAAQKPEGYGLECGECHHDENGEPLNDLGPKDKVQTCYACHEKDGRPKRDSSMSDEQWEKEQLEFYYGAIHENCTGCHKETDGPTVCTECHPKNQ